MSAAEALAAHAEADRLERLARTRWGWAAGERLRAEAARLRQEVTP